MTNQTELIREVRAALEAATPGPWIAQEEESFWYNDRVGHFILGEHFTENNDGGHYGGGSFLKYEDAKVAAKVPTWLQQLTDRLEGQRRHTRHFVGSSRRI